MPDIAQERQEVIDHAARCQWCRWYNGKLYRLGADGWKPAQLSDGHQVLA